MPTQEWESTLREHGGFRIHEAARRFLAEFGGLESYERGPGKTMARMGFSLDPTVAEWDNEIFDVLSEEAGAEHFVFEFRDFDPAEIAARVEQPDLTVITGDGFVGAALDPEEWH